MQMYIVLHQYYLNCIFFYISCVILYNINRNERTYYIHYAASFTSYLVMRQSHQNCFIMEKNADCVNILMNNIIQSMLIYSFDACLSRSRSFKHIENVAI